MAAGGSLLLGSLGTLAYWNQSVLAGGGVITAGDLDLTSKGAGVWKDSKGNAIAEITSYKVVPGDKLTYEQKLDVKLEGTNLAARLDVTRPSSTFASAIGGPVTIKDSKGAAIPNPLTTSMSGLTASTSFEFPSTVTGLQDVKAVMDFSNVKYTLQQVEKG